MKGKEEMRILRNVDSDEDQAQIAARPRSATGSRESRARLHSHPVQSMVSRMCTWSRSRPTASED